MITDYLAGLVEDAVAASVRDGALSGVPADFKAIVSAPRNRGNGDWSTNAAMVLRTPTGVTDGRRVAEIIVGHLSAADPYIEHVEVAGGGFINFYLTSLDLQQALIRVHEANTLYGTSSARAGVSCLIEFVSANPTGPVSVVNGRAAVLGDVLANLLAATGATVSREFYVNDALNSTQLDRFAASVEARYLQQLGHALIMPGDETGRGEAIEPGAASPELPPIHFPADGYRGDYVTDLAREVAAEVGRRYADCPEQERQQYFRGATLDRMVGAQRSDLEAFGVRFDTWFFESTLYDDGEVDRTVAALKAGGHAYTQDGALWLRSSDLGDEKDRVLVRSNEKPTYIAADIAYHTNKFNRGFNRLIDIWGADHHGYVRRLKAGVAALGHDPDELQIVLTQMVSLVRDGEAVIGGKRKGAVVELKADLIDDVGIDAARFYFLLNSYETPATVDVELAKRDSAENPVFYVQYAHARLCNIKARCADEGVPSVAAGDCDLSLLAHPAERAVMRQLADYPSQVEDAAALVAPHRLTRYAMDLAAALNVFYENCRVLPAPEAGVSEGLSLARLCLVEGARIVLRNLLGLLGVNAPESM